MVAPWIGRMVVAMVAVVVLVTSTTGSGLAQQQRYVVQEGDTIASVATTFGVDPEGIRRSSSLPTGDVLQAGQVLVIPGPGQSPAEAARMAAEREGTSPWVQTAHWVEPGETLAGIAASYGQPPLTLAVFNAIDDPTSILPGDRILIPAPSDAPPPTPVAKEAKEAPADGERWIEVNLSTQYLIAWQGDVPVLETYVSTGKPGFDTPPGTYYILVKKPSEDMEGVLGGEYYNEPDVPDTMYYNDVGHAIHGAYWHNDFGTARSHGCVNVPIGTSQQLYEWAPLGTRIVIHD